MSDAYAAGLVDQAGDRVRGVASSVLGIGIVTLVMAVTLLLQWTTPHSGVWGVTVFDVIGLGLLVGGLGTVGVGVASWSGVIDTDPDRVTGLPTAIVAGGGAVTVVGLYCSQTLGWEGVRWVTLAADGVVAVPVGWVLPAVAVGAAVGAWTVGVPEDVGATVPTGSLVALGGGVVTSGVVSVGWEWNLNDVSAVVHGEQAVPLLAVVLGVVLIWTAGKARAGFGAQGRQQAAYLLLGVTAFAMLGVLVLIIVFITVRGAGRAFAGFSVGLDGVTWPFVTNGSTFRAGTPDGVYPSIVGTVWLVIGSVLFAVPLGIGAALFLTEYAEQGRFTGVVEVATNALWSTPSIVFGLFGYALLVPRIGNRNTLLSGMLVLGFMLLPLVIITSRESLKAVPDEYRDASAALGVSQWSTIRSVVLPAAMPGVITGIILGVGRIAGETAPLILVMAGGLNQDSGSLFNPDFLQGAQALPYKLYAIITAGVSGDTAFGWATAFVLLVVVLGFYVIGIGSRIYFRRKLNE